MAGSQNLRIRLIKLADLGRRPSIAIARYRRISMNFRLRRTAAPGTPAVSPNFCASIRFKIQSSADLIVLHTLCLDAKSSK